MSYVQLWAAKQERDGRKNSEKLISKQYALFGSLEYVFHTVIQSQ